MYVDSDCEVANKPIIILTYKLFCRSLQVMKLVINGIRPAIDTISKVPTEYLYLMEECWGEYSEHRPSFTLVRLKCDSI